MKRPSRVLIAGCGRIGTRLGLELASGGDTVWGLRRRDEPLPQPLIALQADLGDPATLRGRLPDAGLVYYIATPDRRDDAGYHQAYVQGLAHLIDALPATGPASPRLVFVSSTAVYGQCHGEWVDEGSPTAPTDFSGRRLLEAETLLRHAPVEAVSVRFGGIYGPGRERMIRRIRAGEPCAAEPEPYTNRIHEDDCIGVLAHLGRLSKPAARYLAVDDAPCTECELMDWLAERLERPRPPRARAEGARGAGKRCRNDRLKASGYRLRYPTYREGYAAMLVGG